MNIRKRQNKCFTVVSEVSSFVGNPVYLTNMAKLEVRYGVVFKITKPLTIFVMIRN